MGKNNFICICGHLKIVHSPKYWLNDMGSSKASIEDFLQDACYEWVRRDEAICECEQFKLDNLKYLENLSEK